MFCFYKKYSSHSLDREQLDLWMDGEKEGGKEDRRGGEA